MKKIFLFLAFAFTALVANAWNKVCDEAAVILASQHLTPEAKSVVDKYLGTNYNDDIQYLYALEKKKSATHSKEIHYLHLNKKLKPKKFKDGDAYAAINEALKVVKAHKSQSPENVTAALRTIINLMCDMHCLSNIRIDKIPHSKYDFEYLRVVAEYGKKKDATVKVKWSKSWEGFNYPSGFSATYRAYDMKLCLDNRYAEFTKGTLADWATDNGKIAAHYLEICKPDVTVSYMDYMMREDVSYDMLIKASCRLAALLNENLK